MKIYLCLFVFVLLFHSISIASCKTLFHKIQSDSYKYIHNGGAEIFRLVEIDIRFVIENSYLRVVDSNGKILDEVRTHFEAKALEVFEYQFKGVRFQMLDFPQAKMETLKLVAVHTRQGIMIYRLDSSTELKLVFSSHVWGPVQNIQLTTRKLVVDGAGTEYFREVLQFETQEGRTFTFDPIYEKIQEHSEA